ncbi:MAG: hypothetical protein AAF355_01250 [Myxococcota bacterium]
MTTRACRQSCVRREGEPNAARSPAFPAKIALRRTRAFVTGRGRSERLGGGATSPEADSSIAPSTGRILGTKPSASGLTCVTRPSNSIAESNNVAPRLVGVETAGGSRWAPDSRADSSSGSAESGASCASPTADRLHKSGKVKR